MAHGEQSGFSVTNEPVEELPLDTQASGASPQPGPPGDRDRRTRRRFQGRWGVIWALGALVLALIVAVAVTAGRREAAAAPVLACPHNWVGHCGVCYYLSTEHRSWDQGWERCSALGASLAMLREKWDLEFISRFHVTFGYWLGMRRQGQGWEWVDGSSVNDTFQIVGQEPCVHLANSFLVSASCSQLRPFLCSKPQALVCGG